MNKQLYIILTALVGLAAIMSSCSEEEESRPKYYYGEVKALKNGMEWQADPAGVEIKLDSVFTFFFAKRNEIGEIQERLALFYVPISSNEIKFISSSPYDEIDGNTVLWAFSTRIDGDSGGDKYELINSSDNYVTIESYDSETKMVSGIFQASFVLVDDSQWTENTPDTVRFTNGEFWTQIVDVSKLEPGDSPY